MPRILVIDDDANVRDILGRILTHKGYEVLVAVNGAEGLRLVRQQAAEPAPIDLVLTDILMPEKEGLETILELRGEFPDLPIIVISGGGSLGKPGNLLQAARAFGARYSFQKPIPRAELLSAVEELVGLGGGVSSPD